MIWVGRRLTWRRTLTQKTVAPNTRAEAGKSAKDLAQFILDILDKQSATEIDDIDLRGKSSIADFMLVASGRSNRHVSALADYVLRGLKDEGYKNIAIEGLDQSDWVLIDVGDVILHLFRPEVRAYYAIEKLWAVPARSGSPSANLN